MGPSLHSVSNRTYEWLTKSDIYEARVQFAYQEYAYGQNWTTQTPVAKK